MTKIFRKILCVLLQKMRKITVNYRSIGSHLIHTGTCTWIFLYCLTFVVILPILCYDMPYSRYYTNKPNQASIKKLNDHRSKEAKITLTKFKSIDQSRNKQKNLDLVIGVITVSRQQTTNDAGPMYVNQVVAKLLKERNKAEIFNIAIFVCNVDSDPLNHKDAMSLTTLIPMVTKYNSINAKENMFNRYNKENKDYSFCLNETMKYDATYSLLLEDDAVPRDNFFNVLRYVTRTRKFSHSNVSLLKLYYPERWQGYSRDNIHAIIDLVALICVFGPLLAIFMYNYYHHKHLMLHFVSSIAFVTTVIYLFGRQNFMNLRRLHEQLYALIPAHGCCTPGVLFTRPFSQKLVSFLDTVTCSKEYPLDIAIADFEKQIGFKGYNVIPNILSHIGSISSLPKSEDIKKISLF